MPTTEADMPSISIDPRSQSSPGPAEPGAAGGRHRHVAGRRSLARLRNVVALLGVLALLLPRQALAQVPLPQLAQPVASFSYEDKDWQVQPTATPKQAPYHGPTPTSIPGARVIRTLELEALLARNDKVVVIDVLDSRTRTTVPGAYWLAGSGGRLFAAEKSRFAAALEKLTGGDRDRPLVFLCVSSECWLSYNASLYALEAGYKDVIWYRGGTDAWGAASLERKKPELVSW
jgi:PQQ-dependent catabolism-associated CXXCW motif protein